MPTTLQSLDTEDRLLESFKTKTAPSFLPVVEPESVGEIEVPPRPGDTPATPEQLSEFSRMTGVSLENTPPGITHRELVELQAKSGRKEITPWDTVPFPEGPKEKLPPGERPATREEIAEMNKAAGEIDPIFDLPAKDLAELIEAEAKSGDPNPLTLVQGMLDRRDQWDPELQKKAAETFRLLNERGWKPPADLGVSQLPGMAKEAIQGAVAWGAKTAEGVGAGGPFHMMLQGKFGQAPTDEDFLKGQQSAGEAIAATQANVKHVVGLVPKIGKFFLGKDPKTWTPEEASEKLVEALAEQIETENILAGGGDVPIKFSPGVRAEMQAAGLDIRAAESASAMAGDPIGFMLFGRGLGLVGQGFKVPGHLLRVAKTTAPGAKVEAALTGAVSKLPKVTIPSVQTVVGRGIQATGTVADTLTKWAEKVAPAATTAATTAGLVAGATGGLGQVVAGFLAGGGRATRFVPPVMNALRSIRDKAQKLGYAGKSIAAQTPEEILESPIRGNVAAVVKAGAQSVPAVIAATTHGSVLDLGLAATTISTPEDQTALQLGTIFGIAQGLRGTLSHAASEVRIGARDWGHDTPVPTSRTFPVFEKMHSDAYATAPRGAQRRVNAIRQFLKSIDAETDSFMADPSKTRIAEDGSVVNTDVESSLIALGESPATAEFYGKQNGWFDANIPIPGQPGKTKRVFVIVNSGSAPHEAKHAFQDVNGELANQALDRVVQGSFTPETWDFLGRDYTEKLLQRRLSPEENWQDLVLEASGVGAGTARQKLSLHEVEALQAKLGRAPTRAEISALMPVILRDGQAIPAVENAGGWRNVLTPSEQKQAADKYVAREISAETFDAVFKHFGPALAEKSGLIPIFARIVAATTELLGGDALRGRTSEVLDVPLKTPIVEEVLSQVRGRQLEVAGRKPVVTPERTTPATPPTTPQDRAVVAEETRRIAQDASDEPVAGGTRSERELLGEIAVAQAAGEAVKLNYLSAPDEPAAAISSNRTVRRQIIEMFRSMPQSARALWEKNFFPERVRRTQRGRIQVGGWAPEVFAANAHKTADALTRLDPALSPYPLDSTTRSFTEEGWRQLYEDVQIFVQNQMAGRTGSGDPLVVPRSMEQAGFFKPPEQTGAGSLDQRKADFISAMFGMKLPDTPRIQRGRTPLNIAGQEVSEATIPGRTEPPTRPRAPYGEPFAGREILEVNPWRAEFERAAQQAGVDLPSTIEAFQWLNMENIREVSHSPEQPQFRGNTLTLQAGFQPKPNDPRAIKEAAVRDAEGKIYTGRWHGEASDKALSSGSKTVDEDGNFSGEQGFVTNEGEFLDRDQAFNRARELKQISKRDERPFLPLEEGEKAYLESVQFENVRAFQPRRKEDEGLDRTFNDFIKGARAAVFDNQRDLAEGFLKRAIDSADFQRTLSRKGDTSEFGDKSIDSKFEEQMEIVDSIKSELKNIADESKLFREKNLAGRVWEAGGKLTKTPERKSMEGTGFKSHADLLEAVRELEVPGVDMSKYPGIWQTSNIYGESAAHRRELWRLSARLADSEVRLSDIQDVAEAMSKETNKTRSEEVIKQGAKNVAATIVDHIQDLEHMKNSIRIANGYFGKRAPFSQLFKPKQTQFSPQTRKEIELIGPDGKKYKARFDGYWDLTAMGRGHVAALTALEDLPGVLTKLSSGMAPTLEKAGYKLPTDLPPPETDVQFQPKRKRKQTLKGLTEEFEASGPSGATKRLQDEWAELVMSDEGVEKEAREVLSFIEDSSQVRRILGGNPQNNAEVEFSDYIHNRFPHLEELAKTSNKYFEEILLTPDDQINNIPMVREAKEGFAIGKLTEEGFDAREAQSFLNDWKSEGFARVFEENPTLAKWIDNELFGGSAKDVQFQPKIGWKNIVSTVEDLKGEGWLAGGYKRPSSEQFNEARLWALQGLPTDRLISPVKDIVEEIYSRNKPSETQFQPKAKEEPRVGLEFKKFFSDVTKGTFGKSTVPFEPITDLSGKEAVVETKTKHSGNFDDHIAKSIPTFYETQIKKASAIAEVYNETGARVLDIAASEGSFGKTISELTDGRVETVSLDPNPDMAAFFTSKSKVPGATYAEESFLTGFEDAGRTYPSHDPAQPYDVITEAMGFQFIDPDRGPQIEEVKRLLKPDGVFLTEQKVRNPDWAANEKKKDDEFKSKYFSGDELKQKDTRVGFSQAKDEAKSVGMVDNMADQTALEKVLTDTFEHVVQYWDSGNFKGYAAGDDAAKVNQLVRAMGNTVSDFSTVNLPREVAFAPNPDIQRVRKEFQDEEGIVPPTRPVTMKFDEQVAKDIADFYDAAPKNTVTPGARKSYDAFNAETKRQYQKLVDAGYVLEPWKGEGAPYPDSAALRKDLADNKHLFYLPSATAIGEGPAPKDIKNYPPLEDSGVTINGERVPFNDLFRAVHDTFGHGTEGRTFSMDGEFQAWQDHARMYSEEAQSALALETLGQNAWFNAGAHLRRPDGSIPKKGDADFIPLHDRGYAPRTIFEFPKELMDRAVGVQFSPRKRKEADPLKFLGTQHGSASKAWILPSGKVEQLGAQWHHDWLDQNPEVQKKYGMKIPAFEGTDTEGVREAAVKKGFARVNLDNGVLVVEVREKDWRNIRPIVEDLIEKNLDDIDRFRVGLLNDTATNLRKTYSDKLFDADSNKEKMGRVFDAFSDVAQTEGGAAFQPSKNPLAIKSAAVRDEKTGEIHTGVMHPQIIMNLLEKAVQEGVYREGLTDDLIDGFVTNKGEFLTREEAFKRAEEIGQYKSAGEEVLESRSFELRRQFQPRKRFSKEDLQKEREDRYGPGNREVSWSDLGEREYKDQFSDLKSISIPESYKKEFKSVDLLAGPSFHDPQYFPILRTDSKGEFPLTETGVKDAVEAARDREITAWTFSRDSQFQPKGREEQEQLFGGREYISPANLTQEELRVRYPEAIVPRNSKEKIASNIVGSPLYKKSDNPVQAFADKLVEFAKQHEDNPVYQLGLRWYSDFAPLLKKEFGKDAGMMAELLAASSPNEKPDQNFYYAVDAMEGFKSGRFDKIIDKFNQGFEMYKSDKWLNWYNKELNAGNIPNPPKSPTPEAFLAHWIYKHNLKPRQSNGQLFGFHGRAILEVMARKWLDQNEGPKVANFVQNLQGTGHEATIDVWADRTMRRVGYEGAKDRWRILPANGEGVSDADFAFSQKAFRRAAEQLGIEPDALQGGLWFAEKQLWADNGWGRLDLGSYVNEMAKLPMIRQAIKQRLSATEKRAKVKPAEEIEFELTPRKINEKTRY